MPKHSILDSILNRPSQTYAAPDPSTARWQAPPRAGPWAPPPDLPNRPLGADSILAGNMFRATGAGSLGAGGSTYIPSESGSIFGRSSILRRSKKKNRGAATVGGTGSVIDDGASSVVASTTASTRTKGRWWRNAFRSSRPPSIAGDSIFSEPAEAAPPGTWQAAMTGIGAANRAPPRGARSDYGGPASASYSKARAAGVSPAPPMPSIHSVAAHGGRGPPGVGGAVMPPGRLASSGVAPLGAPTPSLSQPSARSSSRLGVTPTSKRASRLSATSDSNLAASARSRGAAHRGFQDWNEFLQSMQGSHTSKSWAGNRPLTIANAMQGRQGATGTRRRKSVVERVRKELEQDAQFDANQREPAVAHQDLLQRAAEQVVGQGVPAYAEDGTPLPYAPAPPLLRPGAVVPSATMGALPGASGAALAAPTAMSASVSMSAAAPYPPSSAMYAPGGMPAPVPDVQQPYAAPMRPVDDGIRAQPERPVPTQSSVQPRMSAVDGQTAAQSESSSDAEDDDEDEDEDESSEDDGAPRGQMLDVVAEEEEDSSSAGHHEMRPLTVPLRGAAGPRRVGAFEAALRKSSFDPRQAADSGAPSITVSSTAGGKPVAVGAHEASSSGSGESDDEVSSRSEDEKVEGGASTKPPKLVSQPSKSSGEESKNGRLQADSDHTTAPVEAATKAQPARRADSDEEEDDDESASSASETEAQAKGVKFEKPQGVAEAEGSSEAANNDADSVDTSGDSKSRRSSRPSTIGRRLSDVSLGGSLAISAILRGIEGDRTSRSSSRRLRIADGDSDSDRSGSGDASDDDADLRARALAEQERLRNIKVGEDFFGGELSGLLDRFNKSNWSDGTIDRRSVLLGARKDSLGAGTTSGNQSSVTQAQAEAAVLSALDEVRQRRLDAGAVRTSVHSRGNALGVPTNTTDDTASLLAPSLAAAMMLLGDGDADKSAPAPTEPAEPAVPKPSIMDRPRSRAARPKEMGGVVIAQGKLPAETRPPPAMDTRSTLPTPYVPRRSSSQEFRGSAPIASAPPPPLPSSPLTSVQSGQVPSKDKPAPLKSAMKPEKPLRHSRSLADTLFSFGQSSKDKKDKETKSKEKKEKKEKRKKKGKDASEADEAMETMIDDVPAKAAGRASSADTARDSSSLDSRSVSSKNTAQQGPIAPRSATKGKPQLNPIDAPVAQTDAGLAPKPSLSSRSSTSALSPGGASGDDDDWHSATEAMTPVASNDTEYFPPRSGEVAPEKGKQGASAEPQSSSSEKPSVAARASLSLPPGAQPADLAKGITPISTASADDVAQSKDTRIASFASFEGFSLPAFDMPKARQADEQTPDQYEDDEGAEELELDGNAELEQGEREHDQSTVRASEETETASEPERSDSSAVAEQQSAEAKDDVQAHSAPAKVGTAPTAILSPPASDLWSGESAASTVINTPTASEVLVPLASRRSTAGSAGAERGVTPSLNKKLPMPPAPSFEDCVEAPVTAADDVTPVGGPGSAMDPNLTPLATYSTEPSFGGVNLIPPTPPAQDGRTVFPVAHAPGTQVPTLVEEADVGSASRPLMQRTSSSRSKTPTEGARTLDNAPSLTRSASSSSRRTIGQEYSGRGLNLPPGLVATTVASSASSGSVRSGAQGDVAASSSLRDGPGRKKSKKKRAQGEAAVLSTAASSRSLTQQGPPVPALPAEVLAARRLSSNAPSSVGTGSAEEALSVPSRSASASPSPAGSVSGRSASVVSSSSYVSGSSSDVGGYGGGKLAPLGAPHPRKIRTLSAGPNGQARTQVMSAISEWEQSPITERPLSPFQQQQQQQQAAMMAAMPPRVGSPVSMMSARAMSPMPHSPMRSAPSPGPPSEYGAPVYYNHHAPPPSHLAFSVARSESSMGTTVSPAFVRKAPIGAATEAYLHPPVPRSRRSIDGGTPASAADAVGRAVSVDGQSSYTLYPESVVSGITPPSASQSATSLPTAPMSSYRPKDPRRLSSNVDDRLYARTTMNTMSVNSGAFRSKSRSGRRTSIDGAASITGRPRSSLESQEVLQEELSKTSMALTAHTPPPRKMTSTQVLVQVIAVAIDELDRLILKEKVRSEAAYGFVPGRSFCGRIMEVGWEVKHLRKGDVIFGLQDSKKCGALAEFMAISQDLVSKAPEDCLTTEQIAALPSTGVMAFQIMQNHCSQLPRGARVLILNGHDGIGLLTLQECAGLGLIIVAQCPQSASESGLAICEANGAHEVVVGEALWAINSLHEGSFDLVVDTIGGRRLYDAARRVLAEGGQYVTCFGDEHSTSANPNLKSHLRSLRRSFFKKDRKNIGYEWLGTDTTDCREALEAVRRAAQNGDIVPRLSSILPFADAARAFDPVLHSTEAEPGAVVIRVS